MFRFAFKLLAALCLVLLIASFVLWIRGYWVSDGVMYDNGKGACVAVASYAGGLHVELSRQENIPPTHHVAFTPDPVGGMPYFTGLTGETWGVMWAAPGPPAKWHCFSGKVSARDWRSRYVSDGAITPEHHCAGFVVANCSSMLSNISGGYTSGGGSFTTLLFEDTDALPLVCTSIRRLLIHRIYIIPWWFIVALLSILPALQLKPILRRRRRAMRLRRNLCVQCGYDLRASPERCPECGMASESAGKPITLI